MNKQSSSSLKKRNYDLDLKQFQIRLQTKLCVGVTCFAQVLARIILICLDPTLTSEARFFLIISLPLSAIMALIILLEYLIFKKRGPGIVKYSTYVDLIMLVFFMGDWIVAVVSSFYRRAKGSGGAPCFSVTALLAFTSFSWRTLLVTFIVQKWQLKIIAPVTATIVIAVYAICYVPKNAVFLLVRAVLQVFCLILIIYCEDKLKWKMMWTNLHQEKWLQVNNFILNNIPENIMILDLAGQPKFMSGYCKSFMIRYNLSLDSKDFFRKVRDLQQQCESEQQLSTSTSIVLQMERLTTGNGLLGDTTTNENNNNASFLRFDVLEDFIHNFPNVIKLKNLQEGQFLIYNGKLKVENQPQDKSIEVKISFVQHYENDYIVLIFRDTTQRDLIVTLEETNKYKDQLLASVSHELRAPLNGNINLIEGAVNSPKIPDDIKEALLTPALRCSKFLLHIINDILDMSQIKQKKLRLGFNSGDLKETLRSAAQLVEFQAKKKGIELQVDLDPNLPQDFCTDHLRLSQIVLNLLSNAIKFTREGTIKLFAVPINDGSWVKIMVEDSGIGISKDNLKKLFVNYTHIELEERQIINPTGVGLGLNIASHLVELLAPKDHPSISVVSDVNQGSTFAFFIENKERILEGQIEIEGSENSCEHDVAEEFAGAPHPVLFSRIKTLDSSVSVVSAHEPEIVVAKCLCPKVLIVDDNPFNIMALETILGSLEIKCDSVYSGSDAIKKLLALQNNTCGKECKAYSVIFMDQEMPEMSGADTVREIKRLQEEKLIPSGIRIIGCTAHKAKEEVDRFYAAGLDSCIYKPVSLAMIKDILKGSM